MVHLIFKRWEPKQLQVVTLLLLFLPAGLSTLLIPPFGILKGVAAGLVTFWAVLSLSITLYRISPIHPLYRYPGPFLGRITKWYHVWHVSKGSQHLYIQALHDKYGDIVRLGRWQSAQHGPF